MPRRKHDKIIWRYSRDPEGEQEAELARFKKMMALKDSHGIKGEAGWRPWYDLAVVLAGYEIVDYKPPVHRTAARWRGVAGKALLREYEAYLKKYQTPKDALPKLWNQLYSDMEFETFRRALYAAKAHHSAKQRSKKYSA